MANIQHENVWGTVVSIESENLNLSYQPQIEFLHTIDQIFSTYIQSSQVSKLRTNQIQIQECDPMLVQIWQLSLSARELTDGAFDPWAVTGGFDPSGYVKGWAADQICNQLQSAGVKHIQVNAGGDISLRGGSSNQKPWQIGVAHPQLPDEISKVFQITDGAIATSGTAERGDHIIDPQSKTIAVGARSATVVGPDGGLADALATALIVAGRDGAKWFAKSELEKYSCWVVDRHKDTTWEIIK
jgi:thiamine biosynthesis lipoprotein